MITDLFHGCLDIQQFSDQSVLPKRLTSEQIDYLHSKSEVLYERALSTSGITMEFSTSQPAISFCCSACAFSRNHNSIDIYENGKRTETIPFNLDHNIQEVHYIRRQPEPSTLKIYFPAMASLRVSKLNLGHVTPVVRRLKTLLCLGDSITQGIYSQTASSAYPARLGRALDMEVINQGIGGFYYDKQFLAPVSADAVTIAYGTNDLHCYHDLDIIRQNVTQFYETVNELYPEADVAVISPPWRADLKGTPDQVLFDQICDMILDTAAKYHYLPVDGRTLVDHDPCFFTDEYLHPNDIGFGQYASRLEKQLRTGWEL